MAVRRFLRGTISWDRLEAVARELANRYDEPGVRVEFLEADNWLSVPVVVNDEWFVKVISGQNSVVHALITGARNLGAFSAGTEGFFEHVGNPLQMAERELEATRRMREIGVNAPEPVEAFEVDGLGVLVMEYLPEFRTLEALSTEAVADLAPELLGALATMHEHGLVHGDLRAENVIVQGGELYFIDATTVRAERIDAARAYDLACALAVLAPIVGGDRAVEAAFETYDKEAVLEAREFLDFVDIRPDHDFDVAAVTGEIEKAARAADSGG
ncbi:MAG: RIO1 family regulatory kinase/ATPase [Halobacteriales archaeon]